MVSFILSSQFSPSEVTSIRLLKRSDYCSVWYFCTVQYFISVFSLCFSEKSPSHLTWLLRFSFSYIFPCKSFEMLSDFFVFFSYSSPPLINKYFPFSLWEHKIFFSWLFCCVFMIACRASHLAVYCRLFFLFSFGDTGVCLLGITQHRSSLPFISVKTFWFLFLSSFKFVITPLSAFHVLRICDYLFLAIISCLYLQGIFCKVCEKMDLKHEFILVQK